MRIAGVLWRSYSFLLLRGRHLPFRWDPCSTLPWCKLAIEHDMAVLLGYLVVEVLHRCALVLQRMEVLTATHHGTNLFVFEGVTTLQC